MELIFIVIVINILGIFNLRLLGIKQGISKLMIVFNILGFILYYYKMGFSIKLLLSNCFFILVYVFYMFRTPKN